MLEIEITQEMVDSQQFVIYTAAVEGIVPRKVLKKYHLAKTTQVGDILSIPLRADAG